MENTNDLFKIDHVSEHPESSYWGRSENARAAFLAEITRAHSLISRLNDCRWYEFFHRRHLQKELFISITRMCFILDQKPK